MRRSVLVIAGLLILSGITVLIPKDVEAVGQPTFTMIMIMDYKGFDPDDPIDISTGFIGYDPPNSPTTEVVVDIRGSVEVTSDLPQMMQDIIVELDHYIQTKYGQITVDFTVEPEQLIFTDLTPGETQRKNYTMSLVIDSSVPAGENIVNIGGRWHYDPGLGGGSISPGGGLLHVAPVVSAGFSQTFDEVYMSSNEESNKLAKIFNNGNVREPSLRVEIDGITEAARNGIVVLTDLYPTEDHHFNLDVHLETIYSPELTSWEFEISLFDDINGTFLDSFEFTLDVVEGPPVGDDDDDEPPVGDDDEEPLELLITSLCRRTYKDALHDDLYFWASGDEAGVEQGEHPEVDIVEVNVKREGDDLVVTITMSEIIEEWTSFNVYILPDDGHKQPVLDTAPYDVEDFPDYEPDDALACTDLFSWCDYWSTDEDIVARTCTITGSLRSLMLDGLTEDFEVFVAVSYSDFDISIFEGPGLIVIHETVDYAGSGAWRVENVEEKPMDTNSGIDLSFLILPLVIAGVVFLLVILGVIFFIISRKRKGILD